MTAPDPSPCPDWCEDGPHGFDSATHHGTPVRTHIRQFGPFVSIVADEEAVTPDGPALLMSAPFLQLAEDVNQLFLADAERFAADLAEAVAVLGSLT
jgi:hypothetical protein